MRKLNEIFTGTAFVEILGDPGVEITSMEIDSRKVLPGGLFFALRGTLTDGHEYIDKAVASGAAAVVCESLPRRRADGVTWIRVSDSARTLGNVASAFYGHPSSKLKLVGVTGTNGKTTTATLLYRLFRGLGQEAGLISTVNYYVGDRKFPATHTTPDPVRLNMFLSEMVNEGCRYCFIEVSSHSIVQQRIGGLHFCGGIFTNISHDHLDYHKSFSEYLKAKKHFFDTLGGDSFALVNRDDRNSGFMVQNTKAMVKSYALKTMADFRASVLESHFGGMLLDMNGKELWTSLAGEFNAYNVLAVYAAGVILGAHEDEALRIISSLKPVEGRFETIRSSGNVTAIVDYAHTPDALENVIDAINKVLGGKGELITVAGAGGDRDRSKRPVMARIGAEKSSKLILTSDNPRSEDPESIIMDMMKGVENNLRNKVPCITSREEAIRTACMMAGSGDIVLVAGKGHETYQEIKGVRHHFDDREVVWAVFDNQKNN